MACPVFLSRQMVDHPLQPGFTNNPAVDAVRMAFVMTGELHRNSRALKQLRTLAESGYRVDVWHLSGDGTPATLPDSITIHDLQRPPESGPSFFRQIDRLFEAALASHPAHIVHASDLYALPACRRRADVLGCALTYDAREYYPHVAGTVGKPWARWWWRRIERQHISRTDAVFTVSDSIADALATDYGIKRPRVVHNTPPRSASEAESSVPPLSQRLGIASPIVLHLGQMKAHRGCASLLRAMALVEDAELVFLGYGPERNALEQLRRESGLQDRVHFLDAVPPDQIRATIRDARIGVTMLEDSCLNHRYALPNKLFDYIHAGIPVLGSDLVEVDRVVTSYDIGQTVPADDPAAIAAGIRLMLDSDNQNHWRQNLARAAETFAWESASQRFMEGFKDVRSTRLTPDPDRNTG